MWGACICEAYMHVRRVYMRLVCKYVWCVYVRHVYTLGMCICETCVYVRGVHMWGSRVMWGVSVSARRKPAKLDRKRSHVCYLISSNVFISRLCMHVYIYVNSITGSVICWGEKKKTLPHPNTGLDLSLYIYAAFGIISLSLTHTHTHISSVRAKH